MAERSKVGRSSLVPPGPAPSRLERPRKTKAVALHHVLALRGQRSPMKTKQEIDAANQYGAYQQGWVAGAKVSAMDPKITGHDNELIKAAYEQGYNDGRVARQTAMQKAADKYGHRLSILRLTAEESLERPLHT
jgi:hypothetical protein